jgi:CHAT domain-containing protein
MVNAYHFASFYEGELNALILLSLLEDNSGDITEAQGVAKEALTLAESHNDVGNVRDIRVGLTLLNNRMGTPANAAKVIQELLADPILAADDPRRALMNVNLALVWYKMGDDSQCIKQAQLAEPGVGFKPHDSIAAALQFSMVVNLGVAYARCGEYEKGIFYLNKSTKLLGKLAKLPTFSVPAAKCAVLLDIVTVRYDHGDHNGAREAYRPCLTVLREDFNARFFSALMHLYQDSDPDFAIVMGKRAINLVQEARRNVSPSADFQKNYATWYEDVYRELAGLLIVNGRFWEAKQVLELLKGQEYLEYTERGDSSGSTGVVRLTPRDAVPLVKLQREEFSLAGREKLTKQEQQRKEYLDAQLAVAKLAATEFFNAKGEVTVLGVTISPPQIRADEQADAVALQKDLGTDTAALYTLVGEHEYAALLITPTQMIPWKYTITKAELRMKIFAFHQALSDPGQDPIPLGKELYNIVVGRLDAELRAAKIRTIVWSLDEALRYIPMAALHDDHGYLVERFRSVVYSKASSRAVVGRQDWKVLGAGVSKASPADGLRALRGVPMELDAIVQTREPDSHGFLPGRILLDTSFTEAAFRAGLHQRYPVVHIASHFVFNPTSDSASFLLLGDKKLSLAELRENKNDDYTFQGVQLLTLSACETAAGSTGDGREIDGLGFLAENNGAHSVLATLWSVYDDSTGELMRSFYKELADNPNMTKAEALQRAQLALLNGVVKPAPRGNGPTLDSFANPYFWASFILIGNAN